MTWRRFALLLVVTAVVVGSAWVGWTVAHWPHAR